MIYVVNLEYILETDGGDVMEPQLMLIVLII